MPANPTRHAVLRKHSRVLVECCATVKPKEKVLFIFDGSTRIIEPYLREAAQRAKAHIMIEHMHASIMHCIEPPPNVIRAMERADVILAATKYSIAHTDARFRATKRGARYLSLPQYGIEQLSRSSLDVDFLALADTGRRIKEILDKGNSARVTTPKGTDLEVFFKGRVANWAPGFCHEPGMLGSPPDIETNIAPVETQSKGVLVVDGSIPCESIGLLKHPVRLTVARGNICDISTNREGHILKTLLEAVPDKKRTVLAEFGIGLNPKARLCGLMLEDEGCLGTVHFGFGSNATIGGKNKTAFHLDMVIRRPTVEVDGVRIMEKGSLFLAPHI
ncbi:hypothetical protein A3C94_01095 [Candidatus Kaiserbacteria bacterium RIFCSPHIGHO2_02_FULL_55_17]|uniref:Leucyl aminopeptidase n=1 Tax=Candidatus Kaiserbacteria bacterium RIFCSPHIGHO2_02_FULL_55_17 TaxID=1798496 RepID=A0A1F6DT18_9BACT|nr:MAG: hypothetical protein A3C94_01095 [Candidatus Kaiserbacteria bacterium RIFCSPHIGHO2_02_FULL_55_17]